MSAAPDAARPRTPAEAWRILEAGNARFMAGDHVHPNQDVHSRSLLAAKQAPFAVFFGCADSRVAAEIIFDQGLGDLFVVRTAGHVIDPSVLGSLEFGVQVLQAHLIVVLGHDTCGAVAAAIRAVQDGTMPRGYIRDIVERVFPSYLAARAETPRPTVEQVEHAHVRATCELMTERSPVIAEAVEKGSVAIVGAEYDLAEGVAHVIHVIGDIGTASAA
ncbi:MAG: carbonic anhydrase [Tetrasphaera sp.]